MEFKYHHINYNFFLIALLWCAVVKSTLAAQSVASSQSSKQTSIDPLEIFKHIPVYSSDEDHSEKLMDFGDDFEFGLATAASHIEDNLEDSWLEFARRGGVRAFHGVEHASDRLRFYTHPLTEIKLAAESGVQIFRMSINWNRLVPQNPGLHCCTDMIQNREALERYKQIFSAIQDHGMKVMLTLFHHDLPKWAIPTYAADSHHTLGFTNPKMVDLFKRYVEEVLAETHELVDYVITFNEPTLFSVLTHTLNHWPSEQKIPSRLGLGLGFDRLFGITDFYSSMKHIILAHKKVYHHIKKHYPHIQVGVSHLSPYMNHRSADLGHIFWRHIYENTILFGFPDEVLYELDFLGINYYGEETLSLFDYSLKEDGPFIYSDSGRALNSGGLYKILRRFHDRYHSIRPDLQYFLTENGIADDTDLVRLPFIVEHLYAISHARDRGIPVKGYIFWTISDNWEWADGYCPKFGLVHVDRSRNLSRTPKPSYHLFSAIVKNAHITYGMREYAHHAMKTTLKAWRSDSSFASQWDGMRGFCRDEGGVRGLDNPKRAPLLDHSSWIFKPEDHR